MASTVAAIDIVTAHDAARELLGREVHLVGRLGAAEKPAGRSAAVVEARGGALAREARRAERERRAAAARKEREPAAAERELRARLAARYGGGGWARAPGRARRATQPDPTDVPGRRAFK